MTARLVSRNQSSSDYNIVPDDLKEKAAQGAQQVREMLSQTSTALVVYTQRAVLVARGGTSAISPALRLVAHEAKEMAHGAVDAWTIGRAAVHAGIAKIDEIADRMLPQSGATFAKAAFRAIPATVITAGMLTCAPHYIAGAALLAASALMTGQENAGNGVGLGVVTAGGMRLATGLVTGSVWSMAKGGLEVAYGSRILRGCGLMDKIKNAINGHVPAA